MEKLIYFVILLVFAACNQTGGGVVSEDTGAYVLESISGSALQKATLKDEAGNIIETGYFKDGVKTGTWINYAAGKPFPQKIISYVEGQYHGAYLELNERGQIELNANYKNNKLDGYWGTYRFGRPTAEAEYKNGELDGVRKEYFNRDGKLQKEIHYKNGVQDGPFKVYNEEGDVLMEYVYENGEKVSGGIIESTGENKPE